MCRPETAKLVTLPGLSSSGEITLLLRKWTQGETGAFAHKPPFLELQEVGRWRNLDETYSEHGD